MVAVTHAVVARMPKKAAAASKITTTFGMNISGDAPTILIQRKLKALPQSSFGTSKTPANTSKPTSAVRRHLNA